jgi:hypothetical protein
VHAPLVPSEDILLLLHLTNLNKTKGTFDATEHKLRMRSGLKMTSHCCASTNLKEEKVACDVTEQTLRMRSGLIMTSHCCYCASTNLKEEKVACDVSSGVYGEALTVDLT